MSDNLTTAPFLAGAAAGELNRGLPYEFRISPALQRRIESWLRDEVHPPLVERQLSDPTLAKLVITDENGRRWPYTGVNGEELTFMFTPTSLGTVLVVKHFSGPELDLTDYSSW